MSSAKKSRTKETSGKNSFFTHFFLSYVKEVDNNYQLI